jgi:WD40 repeat protein
MSYARVVSERDRAIEATEKEVVARLAEQTAREESEKAREEERLARQAAEQASYNANVRLSNEYIHDGQYNSAQQTLWRAPVGFRDWEWGYLLELCNQDLFTFAGHEDRIADLALSPDGTRFVTASWDNTARIWDVASGTQAASLDAHEDGVTCAAYSPDGTRIVTGSFDSSASVWDAATGAEIAVLSGHDGAVNSAAFSPDGARVVTSSPDKTARVWNAQSGELLTTLPEQEDNVGQAFFSPDGTHILTVTWRGNVSLWDATSYGHVLSLADPEARCFEAAFSPDGTRILTIFLDTMSETAKVWDAATGQEHAALIGHEDRVLRAVFSPDGRRIATASSDKTARIWDAATGRMLAALKGHDEAVIEIAFSPDGRRIVTGSRDKTAKVWDAGSGELIETLVGHNDWVVCAVFTPDGRHVITASADGTAKLWEPKSGADKQTPTLAIPSVSVLSIDFSADGARLAAALTNGAVRVWDTATLSESVSFASFGEHCRGDISPDGARVAAAFNEPGYGANVWVWDIATQKIAAALDGQVGTVNDIAFSPDGTRVVTASDNLSAKVWDAATGAELMALSSHAKTVFRAAWSPDGKQIVTASSDDAARIWDAATGSETATIPSDRWLDHVSFSPGGHNLLTTTDEFALLWNWASSEVSAALDGEVNGMSRAPFNPKGTRIAGVAGGRAKVWNAVTGSELLTLPGVRHAAFHPDEIRLMTVGPDNAVRFLRAAPFREDMLPGDASMDWAARYEIYRRERLAQERPKAERKEAPFDIVAATRAEVNERLAQLSRICAADAAIAPLDAVNAEEPAPGFLVTEGPAGDALARLCLRKDDVVFAVNGTPVSDEATALSAFAAFLVAQENDASTPLTVAVLRDGQPRELRFMFLDSATGQKKVSFPRETFAGLLAVQLPLAQNNADLIAERDQRQAKWHREPAIEGEPAGFWIDETYNSIVDNFIQQLGLQPGDRILAAGGTPIRSGHELLDAAQRVQQAITGGSMDALTVEVRRGQFRSIVIDLQFE